MRYRIAILLLAVAVVASAQTAKKGAAPGTKAAEQALKDAEDKWVEALAKADAATLGSILADSYADAEQSNRSNKQDILAALKSGDLKIESIKLSDMKMEVYGDAAVVTGSAVQKGTFKGQPLGTNVIFTDTFIKRGGKWIAVASHRSAGS